MVEVTKEDGRKMLQPKIVKDMKFVGHSLNSITNFTIEYSTILATLQELTSDVKKKDEAEGYLSKITSLEFRASLCLLQDVLSVISWFSKNFQRDQLSISDYFNNKNRLVHLLKNLKLKLDLDEDTAMALPNYAEILQNPSLLVIPTRTTRSSRSAVSVIRGNEGLVKKHVDFIERLEKAVKNRFSSQFLKQNDELEQAACLLNDLCSEFVDLRDELVFCGTCGNIFQSSHLEKHHYKNHKGRDLKVSKFKLASFICEKRVSFNLIGDVLSTALPHYELQLEYELFKESFRVATDEVKKKGVKVDLFTVVKHLYSSPHLCENTPKNIRQLILRLVVVSGSEAICETFGSIMERYHHRFANSDLDDTQIQKEMFVSLLGPPIGKALPFVRRCLRKHGKHFFLKNCRSKFVNQGKVVSRKLSEPYEYSLDI